MRVMSEILFPQQSTLSDAQKIGVRNKHYLSSFKDLEMRPILDTVFFLLLIIHLKKK